MYSTIPDAVRLVVANKADLEDQRAVTRAEGVAFARQHGCLFLEVSAKSRLNVQEAFGELVARVCESPALLDDDRRAADARRGVRLDQTGGGTLRSMCGC
jgi:Ras-related protein Rab-18